MSTQTIASLVGQIIAGTGIAITYTGSKPGTGIVTINATGGGGGVLPNDTYLEGRNFLNTLDIGLIKIDAADNTVINADVGNQIKFTVGGVDFWGISSVGPLTPQADDLYDIGFSNYAVKTAYIGTSILGNKATLFIGTVSVDGSDDNRLVLSASSAQGSNRGGEIVIAGNETPLDLGSIFLQAGDVGTRGYIELVCTSVAGYILLKTLSTTRWSVDPAGKFLYSNATGQIFADSLDGADSRLLELSGGGAASNLRAGHIQLWGNESLGLGSIDIIGGNATGNISLQATSATGQIQVYTAALPRWRWLSTGFFVPFVDNQLDIGTALLQVKALYSRTVFTDAVRMGAATSFVGLNTVDGADTGLLTLAAADAGAPSRGGHINLYGNEALGLGSIDIIGGNATGNISLQATSATGQIQLYSNNTGRFRLMPSGDLVPFVDITVSIGSPALRILRTYSQFIDTGSVTIKTQAAYAGSGSHTSTAAVDTANATPATLESLALADNTSYKFRVEIIGRLNSTTAKNIWGTLDFGVRRNNGSAAVLIGTAIKVTDSEGAPGYDFTVDVSGNTVRVRVTGAAGETVSWVGETKYIAVSTAA